MRYLVRSAVALVIYVFVALILHSYAYQSSLAVAEYRGLVSSLPSRLGEPISRYELDRVKQLLESLSIGADVGLSFDSKPLHSYLGEDKFDLAPTIELLQEGRVRPAKLKLELLLAKVDRAYAKKRRVSKYLAYLGLFLFASFIVFILFMIRRAKLDWQQEIVAPEVEYDSFASKLESTLQAVAVEEVTFTGNRAEVTCAGFNSIPKQLESTVQKLAENFVRNSVEHGGAKPEKRLLAGKSDFISIRISFQEGDDHYLLSSWDNGEGLDIDLILSQSVDVGLVSASAAEQMPELQRSKLIFFPGVSTRDKANSIAETDLPLDALRALVKPYLGIFSIQSKVNESFQISVKLPKSACG